jgi:hypothetical protein
MFEYTKNRLRALLLPEVAARLPNGVILSCSQFGEDAVLNALTRGQASGVYVEVGAFHPIVFSNTYSLYCRGWSGLTIEANPDVAAMFQVYRPRDRHVVTCISPTPTADHVAFTRFRHGVYNTFDPVRVEELKHQGQEVVDTISLPTRTLADVVDTELPSATIDVLSIDIEGFDAAVIEFFPWDRHRPRFVVSEYHPDTASLNEVLEQPFARTFASHGYALVTRCGPSLIWRRDAGA